MRSSRTAVLAIGLPVVAYLALLALVAAFYVHPPLVGWIGLAVVATVGIVLGAGALALFPRMRANVEPAATAEPDRLLVLADARCPGERICETVAARMAGRAADVYVVAPVLAGPLHYLATDEDLEQHEASARLDAVLEGLRARGMRAEGGIGVDDPLQSLGDALARFPAGEALVVTSAGGHWLERDLFESARRLVPVLEQVETD